MRFPDGAKSRALLIGTATYSHLAEVPAVRNNLRDLKAAFETHTGLRPEHCRPLLDPPDLPTVGSAIDAVVREAEDLLLVYYSGHGLIDVDGSLHLALPQSAQDVLPWISLPFAHVQRAFRQSRAKTRVLILDCCYSGTATEIMSSAEEVLKRQLRVAGTYTLTSSPANSPSLAFAGMDHTAFTGGLLHLLNEGSPRPVDLLTLHDLYYDLVEYAEENGLPEPQKRGTHTADRLALARNRRRSSPAPSALPGSAPVARQSVTDQAVELPRARPAANPVITWQEVLESKFTTVRLTEGYDEDEIDEFIDKVVDALAKAEHGPLPVSADFVRSAEFTTTRFREGYDVKEVDALLDLVELEFARLQGLSDEGGLTA
ncbi:MULTISPECIES: caspase, EACC1-associated type [Glycomyces]|uniref:DivIVA domain-containing protein n=2 Tax=Glycomyces TaxID=58113 RepID=A0A9X3SWV2_9ACTN|nr:DivIVA domain-containing protein [Glycomyces lechevalierae]MDA1387734.1 DivIVA domain-containing protein [Glycomyces lechevalierae]MDR7337365.1 DivIVA domain-containing protein [Glycomyces lechevalierae]